MSITDPRDISGLVAWYSPEHEAANYTDGQELTTVHDLSGNGNHATAFTTASAKPLFKSTGGPSGGAQRFRFQNGGYLKLPSGVMSGATAGEIMAMFKNDYDGGTDSGWWKFGSSPNSNHMTYSSQIFDDFGCTVRRDCSTKVMAINVWRRVTVWSVLGDWAMYLDGTLQRAFANSDAVGWITVPTIGNSGSAGATNTSTDTFEGDHGAIVLYNRKLTTGERADLVTWMGANPSGGTVTTVPGVPTSLTIDPTSTTADLDWGLPATGSAPTGYRVRLNGGASTDVGNVLTHTYTGLSASTAYNSPGAEVQAYNSAGSSGWASVSFTTDDPAPATPTGLTVDPAETTAELGWSAVSLADGYEVRLDGGAVTDVGNVLSHVFSALTPATLYDSPGAEVRAYNETGASAWASVSFTTDTPPVPGSEGHTVDLTVGSHTWQLHTGDPAEGDVLVLDNLQIGWAIQESDPWPAQPQPVGAGLQMWTEDVANLDDVVVGTPVAAIVTDTATEDVIATFHGRVASQNASARIAGPNGLGMLYSLTGVDYTVDLAELPLSIPTEWPAESADARFARIVDAIAAQGVEVDPPDDTGTAAFAALTPGATNALALLSSHLDQVAVDLGDGPQRYIVVPVVDGTTLVRFTCTLLDRSVDAGLLPGVLEVVDGLLTLTFPDENADGVVPAAAVELEAPWNRLKYRAVNQVIVTGDTVSASATRGGPPVRLSLSTTLTDQAAADLMAALYLPDVDETNGWVADSLRLHAVDPDYRLNAPQAIVPAWFPDHRADPATTAVYVMPIAIRGIPGAINLAGDLDVYAGQLVQASLTLTSKKLLVDFALRRQLPTSTGGEAVTWEWVLDTYPTIGWDDVDPALSWYDIRLARRP